MMGGFEGLLLMEEHMVMAVKIYEKTSPSIPFLDVPNAVVFQNRGSALLIETADFRFTRYKSATDDDDDNRQDMLVQ
jgi:hypothetical protein